VASVCIIMLGKMMGTTGANELGMVSVHLLMAWLGQWVSSDRLHFVALHCITLCLHLIALPPPLLVIVATSNFVIC